LLCIHSELVIWQEMNLNIGVFQPGRWRCVLAGSSSVEPMAPGDPIVVRLLAGKLVDASPVGL
jgi:hypothetical protein